MSVLEKILSLPWNVHKHHLANNKFTNERFIIGLLANLITSNKKYLRFFKIIFLNSVLLI